MSVDLELKVLAVVGLLIVLVIGLTYYCYKEDEKACNAEGGHIVDLYESYVCVKDGLILD